MKKVEAFDLLWYVLKNAIKKRKEAIFVITGRGKEIEIAQIKMRQLKLFRYIRDEFLKKEEVKGFIRRADPNEDLGTIFIYLR